MTNRLLDFQKKHRDLLNSFENFVSTDDTEDIDIWVPKDATLPLSIYERPEITT